MLKARDVVIYFALKYNGNWDAIYQAISKKESIDEQLFMELSKKQKANCLTILDELYPEKLKTSIKPPFALFYYGHIDWLQSAKIFAVIGTRSASEYGVLATTKIVASLVDNNIIILSGLALGIDAVAHSSAYNRCGKTIGVLASGIDKCYPLTNKYLYEEMRKNQLIISEYPFDSTPTKEKFPIRNRIIAALSDGIIVTEAYAKSGTLVTVNLGLQLNKDIYCVPFPLNANSINNQLIKEGALLIEGVEDINI